MHFPIRFFPFVLLGLVTACGQAEPSQSVGKEQPANYLEGDLEPRVLEPSEDSTYEIELIFDKRMCLQNESGLPLARPGPVSFGQKSFLVADIDNRTLLQFSSEGDFLAERPDKLLSEETGFFGIELATSDQGAWIAMPGASPHFLDFQSEAISSLDETELRTAYSVHLSLSGTLVMGLFPPPSSDPRGPFLALAKNGKARKTFYRDRTKPLGPQEDFRMNYLPLVHVVTDAGGNIYTCEGVDYEIRKYDSEGNYLGDFRILDDPSYLAPPEKVDKERLNIDAAFRESWDASWSRVRQLEVVENQFLVASLENHRPTKFSLHFYTLDGRAARSAMPWDHLLMGSDTQGRLYFLEEKGGGVCLLRFLLRYHEIP